MDYNLEFIFRNLTEEEAIKKATEIHDFIFMNNPNAEFEIFVGEIQMESELGLPGIQTVYHWPENATGPFGDITWEVEDDETQREAE